MDADVGVCVRDEVETGEQRGVERGVGEGGGGVFLYWGMEGEERAIG